MRVVLLGPYPPPHGGVQTNLVAIRQYLRDRGIWCGAINLTRHRGAAGEDVYYPRSGSELLRLLLHLRYDILHLHIGGNLTPRLLGLLLVCTLMPRAKTVLTFHSGGYPSSPEGKTAAPWTLRGLIFRRLDAIIGVNAEIVNMFERFGVPPKRLRLIYPHAVLQPASPAEYPEELGRFLKAHTPVLLTVGLLEPEYDLPLQIEALGPIRARFPAAGLAIIGSGSLEGTLRERIAAQPWRDHILLCGDVPHDVALRAIADCDALLRTTLYDGDSISVREALHLGTPVIATDNGMRPEGVALIRGSGSEALCAAIGQQFESGRAARRPSAGEENLEAVLRLYRDLV